MAGALDGICVIDFGQYVAGPLAGMLLADQGADVIKVDPTGGARLKIPANATWNRGKRSIHLDLKDPADADTAGGLVATADVVVENFRPGVMRRLGLGPEEMCKAHPQLVYCSIPGFATDDPRANVKAFEGVVGAASATYIPRGEGPDPSQPVYTAIPIASSYAAFQAAVAITMALNARERDGLGQRIEVPLFNAMFPSIGARGMKVHDPSKEPPSITGLLSGHYECKDGRWVRFSGSGNQNFREFCDAAGVGAWSAEGLTDFYKLLEDPALATEAERRCKELFKTRTAQEWEDLVAEAGSECTMSRTAAEWFHHPHAIQSKMVIEVDDPIYGKMLQPGIAARMSATPGAVRTPSPTPDQHHEEILTELKPPRPARSTKSLEPALRSALDGVKVLDLCIILAGPTLGRTMAEFGANVIKIDNPARGRTVARHNDVNRGKRSILLDLKSEEGRDVFWRLLEDADVVAQNYRAGKLQQLGLDYESVRARKPDIVYASLNAFGHIGPWAMRPGHEQFAQAATGMDRRFGGEGRPAIQPNTVNDYGTGYMGAYAVALALLHRQRTGQGQHVDAALAYTAMTLQSAYNNLYQGKAWDEASGQDAVGDGPLHRAYKAADGWFFIGADEADLDRLNSVEGLSGAGSLSESALAQSLQERFRSQNVDTWVHRLIAADIGAHRVIADVDELMHDPWVVDHELSLTREHDDMGLVTTCGPAPRLSRTPVTSGWAAPKPGRNAKEILAEAGMADSFDRLVRQQVILMDGIGAG